MEQLNIAKQSIWKSKWLILSIRIIIGAVFIYASIDKIIHPDRFAEIIMDYEILHWNIINIFAIWLPWLELVVGLLIISGIWVRPCAFLLSILCILFITGIAFTLAHGVALHCGCFSTSSSEEVRTWLSLWQEGLLLIGCIWLWIAYMLKNL
ncbi:MAG: DoxX family protein [Armatimonadetes bacterium CG07_land_8_20_14_0_80_40_9]|nr:MAG: DoxX family protein [Armatimonadetes bacterium CG07_land_8_20_14_0_80_40_9]